MALGRFVCLISARLSPALVVKSTFACLCLALVPLMLAHPCLALVHSISCLSCVHPVDAYLSLSGVHPFDVFSFLSSTCPVDVCPVPVSRSYSHSQSRPRSRYPPRSHSRCCSCPHSLCSSATIFVPLPSSLIHPYPQRLLVVAFASFVSSVSGVCSSSFARLCLLHLRRRLSKRSPVRLLGVCLLKRLPEILFPAPSLRICNVATWSFRLLGLPPLQ